MEAPSPADNRISPDLDLHAHPVILFDGLCNLCSASVTFIMDRDPEAVFRFAPLQSDVGQALTAQCGIDTAQVDSIVLVEGDRCFVRSTAALHIARRLDGLWPVLYALIAIPEALRDVVYDIIAVNRYRWFGKKETCRLPTPEDRARFLDYELPEAVA